MTLSTFEVGVQAMFDGFALAFLVLFIGALMFGFVGLVRRLIG